MGVVCSKGLSNSQSRSLQYQLSATDVVLKADKEKVLNERIFQKVEVHNFSSKFDQVTLIPDSSRVYVGHHKQLKTKIAIKVIELADINNNLQIDYILRLHDKPHPHLVQIYEIYHETNKVVDECKITHKYALGGNLVEQIKKSNIFTPQRALTITYQILLALLFLHSNNIYLESLNPRCVLFSEDSIYSNILVTYLGNPRKLPEKSSKPPSFYTQYKSPEKIKKLVMPSTVKGNDDVWACGVMLYQMLTGQLPFKGKSESSLQREIERGVILFQGPECEDLGKPLKLLLEQMLLYNPAKRATVKKLLTSQIFQTHMGRTVDRQSIINFRRFKIQNTFQQVILQYMIFHLISNAETKTLMKTFETLDKNKDQKLTKQEIIEGFVRRGENEEEKVHHTKFIEEIFSKLDEDNNGEIDYREFIYACSNKRKLLTHHNLQRAFHAIDVVSRQIYHKNCNGYINYEEMQDLLKEIHRLDLNAKEIHDEVNPKKNGKLCINDFFHIMHKITC